MNKRTRLVQLQRIADASADAALVPVKAAMRDVQRIEGVIAELAHHRESLMRAANDPTIAGPLLAQANRLRQQQAEKLQELARARLELEKRRAAAAKAVGRSQALKAVSDRQAEDLKRAATRRRNAGL